MLKSNKAVTKDLVNITAKSIGLDLNKFNDKLDAYTSHITEGEVLASAMNLEGTPAFVITSPSGEYIKFVPGAISQDQFQAYVDEASKSMIS